MHFAYPVEMEIAGNTAMWTRPDTGDCPVTYPAPTCSAVKGIFESVLWGPDVVIVPKKVEICAPVHYHTYITNYGGPLRETKAVTKGTQYQLYATVLIDVCYKLYAEAVPLRDKSKLSGKAAHWDRSTTSPGHAYQAIFTRRLSRGQCFRIPCLGWQEFTPSYWGPLREETCPIQDSFVIPSMLSEVFPHGYQTEADPVFERKVMVRNGVLRYERQVTG